MEKCKPIDSPFSIKLPFLIIGGYVLLLIWLMYHSYHIGGNSTFWIGLLLFPYILISNNLGNKSWRLGIVIAILLLLCFLMPTYSIRYILLIFLILFAIESYFGKLNTLPLWLLFIISPIFKYASEIFSFPIRIKLSEWVGVLLQKIGFSISVLGNIIHYKNNDFLVEPACMGLEMIGLSLLIGIFLITHNQRLTQRKLSAWLISISLVFIFCLNIFSNLTRIILLVLFHIPPETPLHDIIGIVCLLVYVWLPSSVLIKWLFNHYSVPFVNNIHKPKLGYYSFFFQLILLFFSAYLVVSFKPKNIDNQLVINKKANYTSTDIDFGIRQFKNAKTLVYVKPIADYYSGEHSPLFCWKASGFELKSVKEMEINRQRVYVSTLEKGNEVLYTAWWFSNQKVNTISQLDWRWRVFKGEPKFQLINVTVANSFELENAVKEWL